MPMRCHRHAATLLMALGCTGIARPLHAQQMSFQVPAGPAASRIAEFAEQAQVNVLAAGNSLVGIRTNAVTGSYPIADGLQKLLAGTGLSGNLTASGAIFITPAPAAARGEAPAGPRTGPAEPETVAQVTVTGERATQQSSIRAQKYAATAVDVIVSQDVGSFPDRNLAEAISRVAGVSLERGDFGEGRTVEIRGNRADQLRIEIDGMALLAAGGTDMNLGGGARGVELRELSADLIAAITVSKGATPDMTEGSLGGGVQIRTRTGLDFKTRHLSARVAATRSSLNQYWTPNLNLTYADKFAEGRLGVLLNVTQTVLRNEGHFNQNASSGISGYVRNADFDNAPQKTFTFQPQTIDRADPAVLQPLLRVPTSGGGTIDFESTAELLTKAANARSKAECFTAFPAPADAALAAMATSAARDAAVSFRSDAVLTCLNQWNDYTPPQIRNIIKRNHDRRLNTDLRLDFRVDRQLSVYAKFLRNERRVLDEFVAVDRGAPLVGAGAYTDVGGERIATPGSGTSIAEGYSKAGTGLVHGVATAIVPGSVVVDSTHHVTDLVMNNAGYFVDNIHNPMRSNSRYLQAGGSYQRGDVKVDFMTASSAARFERADTRLNGIGYLYGQARLTAQPDGSWRFTMPDGQPGQADSSRYAELSGQADLRAPWLSRTANLLYTPSMGTSAERQVKLDVAWSPRAAWLPFLGTMKFGVSRRAYDHRTWRSTASAQTIAPAGAAGPAVILPASQVRVGLVGCEPGSATDALPCPAYGYTPGTDALALRGSYVMRHEQFANLLSRIMTSRTNPYFHGAAARPMGLLDGWTELDVGKAVALLGLDLGKRDCVRTCVASDGTVQEQPGTLLGEKILAGYWMTEFDLTELPSAGWRLPWGMELNGNFGWRYVHTAVTGQGHIGFTSVVKNGNWDQATPYAPAGLTESTVQRRTAFRQSGTDLMPMLNLMFWPRRDELLLRYGRSKTIARPSVANLVSSGTCRIDQVIADANAAGGTAAMPCTGDFGNPGLRATTNINQSLSLEWYPGRDTMLSVSAFSMRGVVGAGQRVVVTDRLFDGTDAVDPATGTSLRDIRFTHATVVNGLPTERRGWEVATRLAFVGLPWLLRHTGLDANYSKTRPAVIGSPQQDLLTGDPLDPQAVPRWTWNASAWYDDGRFSARAALQVVATTYTAIGPWYGAGTTLRNYAAPGVNTSVAPPWNPGSANFNNATRYLDLKMAYRFNEQLALFGELRNAGRRMVVRSQGPYNHFESGAQTVNEFIYTGSRATLGLNLKY